MKDQRKQWTRRQFLTAAVAGAAGVAVIPHLSGCKTAPVDDSIRLGFIGLGRQAMFLMNGFLQIQGVKVLAGCDVYGIKRQRFDRLEPDTIKGVKRVLRKNPSLRAIYQGLQS